MEEGMVFDLFREGQEIKRCMAINSTDAVDLKTLEIIKDIDFENEVNEILIMDILNYPF